MVKRYSQFLFALAFLLLTACWLPATAQDVIYLGTGDPVVDAKLVDVSVEKVKFVVMRGGKPREYQLNRSNVLLAFTQEGNFLIISELNADSSRAQAQLREFLTAPAYKAPTDYLLRAVPLSVIPGKVVFENDLVVNYVTQEGNSASIKKEELLAILYRDGRHALIRSATEVAPLLPDIRRMLSPNAVSPPPQPVQQVQVVQNPPPVVERPVVQIAAPAPVIKQTGPAGKATLDEQQKEEYRQRSLQRVEEFVQYLNIITDKSLSSDQRDRAINQATQLFMPEATIEVTSKNRPGSRRYPIRDYLTRLKLLPYEMTEVKWTEVQFVKDLMQAADGNYYGLITGQQTFTGFGSGQELLYSDVTPKSVRVKLQSYQKIADGQAQTQWQVLLGNIGVVR